MGSSNCDSISIWHASDFMFCSFGEICCSSKSPTSIFTSVWNQNRKKINISNKKLYVMLANFFFIFRDNVNSLFPYVIIIEMKFKHVEYAAFIYNDNSINSSVQQTFAKKYYIKSRMHFICFILFCFVFKKWIIRRINFIYCTFSLKKNFFYNYN